MTEFLEKVSGPTPEPPEEKKEERKPIKVRCSFFFDGTLNNRKNTKARLDNSDAYKKNKGSKKQGDGSYENDYTNVSTLEANLLPKADGHDEMISIYTEGPGTVNYSGDETRGFAFGSGDTGVKMKVSIGINDAVRLISKGKDKRRKPEKFIIEKLTLDVFGFSRGAAAARYCIYKLLKDKNRSIHKRLELAGFEVAEKAIEVCFAGLFDTVSSYNGGQYLHTDNWVLALKSVSEAKKVVQLAAAEEHRKNFPLHNIKSAGGKGEQFYLPGVHSDVGGSYREGEMGDEDMVVFEGGQWEAERDSKNLIESGWYKPEEVTEEIISVDEFGVPDFVKTKVTRKGISNAYCSIPLKIMVAYARDNGIDVKTSLDKKASRKIKKIPELGVLEKHVKVHIAAGSSKSSAEYWIDFHKKEKWYGQIRHGHLHFSAKCELGLSPRLGFFSGKRQRYEFDG
ncbi:MAG: hypothetical protein DRQ44_01870 [Gammaproteobacteria bacterium]|nr:MAG: hypothetical protein DRQ44_01870 [Gammaproteobacteria bacterium]